MDALSAPLLHVQRSDALWLIPAAPIVGALVRRVLLPDTAPQRTALLARLAPTTLALLVAGSQVFGLTALEPDSRQLIAPGWVPLRLGSLEASLGLALDPLSALLVIAIALLGIAAHAHAGWNESDESQRPAAIDLAVAGGLFAVLGDGFLGVLVGSALAAASITAVTLRAGALAIGRIGDAALVLGAVLLFWTLGGSWGISIGNEPTFTRRNPIAANVPTLDPLDADDPGLGPSMLPVVIGARPGTASSAAPDFNAKGMVTVAISPGSRVYLRGSSEPTATTPMLRHEVFAGRFDVEIERPGEHRQRFRAIEVPPGREVEFVPVGPTVSFRELRDQLQLTDSTHRRFVREVLDPAMPGHRRVFGLDAVTLIAALLGLAALVPIAATALGGTALLVEAIVPLVAVYLLARVGFLYALSPRAAAMVGLALAGVALLSALRAAFDHLARSVIARILTAQLAIAAISIVIAVPALGVLHAIASVFAAALGWVTLDALGVRGLRRVSGLGDHAPGSARVARVVAIVLAGSPIPLLGAAFTREAILGRLFVSEVPLAKVSFVLSAAAAIAIAFATWRAFFLVFAGPAPERPLDDPDRRVVSGLMIASATLAVVVPMLGWSRAVLFGLGAEHSVVEAFLERAIEPAAILGPERAARFLEAGRGAELSAVVVAIVGAVAAWFFARKRYLRGDRAPIAIHEIPAAVGLASVGHAATRTIARVDELIFARPLGAFADLILRVTGRGRRS